MAAPCGADMTYTEHAKGLQPPPPNKCEPTGEPIAEFKVKSILYWLQS